MVFRYFQATSLAVLALHFSTVFACDGVLVRGCEITEYQTYFVDPAGTGLVSSSFALYPCNKEVSVVAADFTGPSGTYTCSPVSTFGSCQSITCDIPYSALVVGSYSFAFSDGNSVSFDVVTTRSTVTVTPTATVTATPTESSTTTTTFTDTFTETEPASTFTNPGTTVCTVTFHPTTTVYTTKSFYRTRTTYTIALSTRTRTSTIKCTPSPAPSIVRSKVRPRMERAPVKAPLLGLRDTKLEPRTLTAGSFDPVLTTTTTETTSYATDTVTAPATTTTETDTAYVTITSSVTQTPVTVPGGSTIATVTASTRTRTRTTRTWIDTTVQGTRTATYTTTTTVISPKATACRNGEKSEDRD